MFTKKSIQILDHIKQAQEIIFSRFNFLKKSHLLFVRYHQVTQTSSQKHLEIILDTQQHSKNTGKTIWVLRKLQNTILRTVLITIYKAFIKPHREYDDIIIQ